MKPIGEDSRSTPFPVVVELGWQRIEWGIAAVLLLFLGVLGLVGAAASLFSGRDLKAVVETAGLGALALVCLAGARFGLRAARTRPRVLVEGDAIVLDHPALLTALVRVHRREIREVWIRDVKKQNGGSVGATSRRRKLRTSIPPSEGAPRPPVIVSSRKILPDLSSSLLPTARESDVLVVFRGSYDLDGFPRRGLAALALFGDEWGTYDGPVRKAHPHGFVFRVRRPEEAERAFRDLGVLVDRPSTDALEWVAPSRKRSRRP